MKSHQRNRSLAPINPLTSLNWIKLIKSIKLNQNYGRRKPIGAGNEGPGGHRKKKRENGVEKKIKSTQHGADPLSEIPTGIAD